jgi:small-conductance mechanosensitive channel
MAAPANQAEKVGQDLSLSFRPPVEALADLYAWLASHWFDIALAAAIGVCLYLALTLIRRILRRLCEKGGTGSFGAVLGRAVVRTSHVFMALVAARLVVGYANPPNWLRDTVGLLFTVVAVFQAAVWAREVVLGLVERRADPTAGHDTISNAMGIIRLLVSVALFAIATIVVLDNIGVNVTGLVAGLGIGGIAIGLAAQGIFSDLFAALSIIFDRPFRTGDTVAYDTTVGTVERIGLKSTHLRAITGERKIISNTQLLSKELTNYADLDHRRIKFAIGVIYQTPPDIALRIPEILRTIVEENGGTFVRSGFVNFGASSLDFEVEFDVFLPDWDTIYMIRHKIGLGMLSRFLAEGIEFAYPTQTTFTAAPDGSMILPYAGEVVLKPPATPQAGAEKGSTTPEAARR